jgi:hypothetical protein
MGAPSRRERILGNIEPERLVGLEFGPLTRPIVTKSEGRVDYVDYLDGDGLREKYETDPNVDTASIVEVDIVLENGRLPPRALGGNYDYIIASHVFEHLADPIGWLAQCGCALRAGGALCLALPDRRYSFDILRSDTPLRDWIDGYVLQRSRPSPGQVFDAVSHTSSMPNGTPWHRAPTPEELRPSVDLSEALALAKRAIAEHVDVHCSTFTPAAWFRLLGDLRILGLCSFELAWSHDTQRGEIEFFAGLRNTGPSFGLDKTATDFFDAASSVEDRPHRLTPKRALSAARPWWRRWG